MVIFHVSSFLMTVLEILQYTFLVVMNKKEKNVTLYNKAHK